MTDLHWMTASAAAQAIAAKELSPVELMTALLSRIERIDPKLNAFLNLDATAAMDAARSAEAEAMAGMTRLWTSEGHGPLRLSTPLKGQTRGATQ